MLLKFARELLQGPRSAWRFGAILLCWNLLVWWAITGAFSELRDNRQSLDDLLISPTWGFVFKFSVLFALVVGGIFLHLFLLHGEQRAREELELRLTADRKSTHRDIENLVGSTARIVWINQMTERLENIRARENRLVNEMAPRVADMGANDAEPLRQGFVDELNRRWGVHMREVWADIDELSTLMKGSRTAPIAQMSEDRARRLVFPRDEVIVNEANRIRYRAILGTNLEYRQRLDALSIDLSAMQRSAWEHLKECSSLRIP